MTIVVPSRPARPIRVDGGGRIPVGGTTGQALVKSSDNDYATEWGTATAAAAWGSVTGTLSAQTDLQSALDAKQATLVSGTNIKTLNGSTILGSGDLVISASAAWGGITGTLSSQTDLQTALDAKANTSSLAAVATSGSASDLGTGTLSIARIADGAVTLAKLANMATASVYYRKTAGSGVPEVQTLATLKTDLGLTGTNSGDQTITLTGMVTGSGTGSFAASLGSFTKAQLNTAVSDGDVLYVGDVTSNATHTGDATGSTALTLATVNSNVGSFGSATQVATFTVNAKGLTTAAGNATISIPMTAISDSTAAGRSVLGAATATAQTALFDVFTSAAKGLAPASGGGTTNFLRADGTWAAPSGGGGGTPGGSTGEVQYNNAGAFAGAADVEIEGGQLRLPSITTPTAPASGGAKIFGLAYGNAPTPAFIAPLDVAPSTFQIATGEGNFMQWMPATGTGVSVYGWPAATATGTATAAGTTVGSRRARMKRLEYLVTVAATTAVAGWRIPSAQITVGGGNSWEGGFRGVMHGGPSTGVTNGSHRFFMGLSDTAAPTDVNPSTILRIVGIGYDAADTNVQFMTNDATGSATKVDLGASFPKPNADRAFTYRLRLYSPPGTTQRVDYEVTYLETGAVATGTVTADLPATNDVLAPKVWSSVGGVSAVTGVAVGSVTFQTEQY